MNASETIQAAIDKLESQQRASLREPEDWHLDLHDDETAALLLTLHRTIDAQLVILRHAHRHCGVAEARGETPKGPGLDLARAILGEAS